MTSRLCPGCGVEIAPGRYACGRDWHRLPAQLRTQVLATWGRYRTLIGRPHVEWEDVEQARDNHDRAKTAADAWLKANPR